MRSIIGIAIYLYNNFFIILSYKELIFLGSTITFSDPILSKSYRVDKLASSIVVSILKIRSIIIVGATISIKRRVYRRFVPIFKAVLVSVILIIIGL